MARMGADKNLYFVIWVKSPPLDLWPEQIRRVDPPQDVCREVLEKLN